MKEKIIEVGPGNVSSHCKDANKYNVVDIGIASLSNPNDFYLFASKSTQNNLIKILNEPQNNCYHLEFKK
jgi:hypothetical protein